MVRKLRIVAACFCFAVCAGTLTIWPLSYAYYISGNHVPKSGTGWHASLGIFTGVVRLVVSQIDGSWNVVVFEPIVRAEEYAAAFKEHNVTYRDIRPDGYCGISCSRAPGQLFMRFTLTWPLVIAGAFSVALKPSPRFRYSTRELFALTTIAALVIGGVAVYFRYSS